MTKFSKYAGSKTHFIKKFNAVTSSLDCKKYVEPFFGSGAIYFNLDKNFDEYVINDINKHVINTVKSFKNGTYEEYNSLINLITDKFGDIKNDKQCYYNIRNWFNNEYFGKNKNLIEEGFILHVLMNSCFNSMSRFTANKFSQGYGNRYMTVNSSDFDNINQCLNNNTTISSVDYKEIIIQHDSPETLFFLDPPYFVRNNVGYQSTFIENNLKNFIEFIKNLKSKVIYTDINCNIHDELGWKSYKSKIISNLSGTKKYAMSKSQEVFFCNFDFDEEVLANI